MSGNGAVAPGGTGSLREFLLAPRWREQITTVEIAGISRTILVREPSLEIRDEYLRRLDLRFELKEDDEVDQPDAVEIIDDEEVPDASKPKVQARVYGNARSAQVALAIGCSFDPDKKDENGNPVRVFNWDDEELIMNMPSGHSVEVIADMAQDFMKEARETAKNSEAIPKNSSSSGSRKKLSGARSRSSKKGSRSQSSKGGGRTSGSKENSS